MHLSMNINWTDLQVYSKQVRHLLHFQTSSTELNSVSTKKTSDKVIIFPAPRNFAIKPGFTEQSP